MTDDSVTGRMGVDFSTEIEEIISKRKDLGIDKKRKSIKKITNLLVKHRDWAKIKKDTIEINLEGARC